MKRTEKTALPETAERTKDELLKEFESIIEQSYRPYNSVDGILAETVDDRAILVSFVNALPLGEFNDQVTESELSKLLSIEKESVYFYALRLQMLGIPIAWKVWEHGERLYFIPADMEEAEHFAREESIRLYMSKQALQSYCNSITLKPYEVADVYSDESEN